MGTIAEAGSAVARWFDKLAIVPADPLHLPMSQLLRGIAVREELENAPPLLEAELLHAACTGAQFPQRVARRGIGALHRRTKTDAPTRSFDQGS
jgi:hypothetical protein